jgi:integrase
MNRKRRRQKGSLKKLRYRDGRLWWRLQWRKPGEKNVTTKWLGKCSKMSKKAAEGERDRVLEPINAGLKPQGSSMMNLSDFIDTVFVKAKQEAKRWREDSTAPTSRGILDNHLKPALGAKLIHLITRLDLQGFLNRKAAAGCSYSLVQHLHSFIGEIFEMAFADRLVPLDPAQSVVIPKCKPRKPKPVLTPEDIDHVAQSLDIRERLMFWLATPGGGMRPGEIEGLKVGDLGKDRISITRRIYRGSEGEPKTRRSSREVPIAPRTAALIAEYRKLLVDDGPEAWLFPSENAKRPVRFSNVFRRIMRPALKRIGLGYINFQAMRRTFASQGKASGIDAKTRSDIMGHSVDVNENQYAQTPFDVKEEAMREVEKRLLH